MECVRWESHNTRRLFQLQLNPFQQFYPSNILCSIWIRLEILSIALKIDPFCPKPLFTFNFHFDHLKRIRNKIYTKRPTWFLFCSFFHTAMDFCKFYFKVVERTSQRTQNKKMRNAGEQSKNQDVLFDRSWLTDYHSTSSFERWWRKKSQSRQSMPYLALNGKRHAVKKWRATFLSVDNFLRIHTYTRTFTHIDVVFIPKIYWRWWEKRNWKKWRSILLT